jgi:hypothetical protein
MSALRRLQNFWILWVTAMVLACFSNAVAQARYKVQDQGVQHPDNLGMAMGLNNYGWTLIMDQSLDHSVTSTQFPAVSGTVRISIRDLELPLARLEERTVRSTGTESMTAGKLSVCRKHRFPIRTAKTFALSAHTLPVIRFSGKTA